VDAEYGRTYRDLYTRHWWWRAREAALLDVLAALRPPQGWGRILDIGCGDGLFFDRLLEMGDVEGIEPDEALVDPRGAHRDRIHVQPFDEAFRPAHQYSLILMLDVLEHLEEPVEALRHASRLLAEGGRLVVTVPAFMLLWTNHDVINHHRTRYTRATFRAAAARASLQIDAEPYWFQWMVLPKLATRAVERVFRVAPAPPRVPPTWLNGLLYALSRVERRVIGPLRLPFGSSLVVVCRPGPLNRR
jgi:2-polyprenyl-3-methyl-5-hydroxy-6-metoxy-1,4-benzoquinol methylase